MATTKVIKDLTEFNPGNPDYVLNATNAVTVSSASGSNKYYFDGVYNGKFGLRIGTTVLTGIPVSHPFTIMNNGKTSQITISGSDTVSGTAPNGDSYTFYYNTATITVLADFGTISYACSVHGYMGGLNNFVSVYSEAGLRMPKGGAFSGTPAEGMIRNDNTQASEGSASTMQHYNNTEWKNYVNTLNLPQVVSYLVVAGGGGGGGGRQAYGAASGGGAGGYRNSFSTELSGGNTSTETPIALVVATNYTVTVGTGGGGGSTSPTNGTNGNNSVFSTITATGGGGGISVALSPAGVGQDGGSGGGGGYYGGTGGGAGGSGSAGQAVTPTQGFNGGFATGATSAGPGGGGAAALGVDTSGSGNYGAGSAGGAGLSSNIDGGNTSRAGGGGGSSYNNGSNVNYAGGAGGSGGGGAGGGLSPGTGVFAGANGTDGTGGGGGAGAGADSSGSGGGDGGKGIVILRYPATFTLSLVSGSLVTTVINQTIGTGEKYTTFETGSGDIKFN